MCLVKCTHNYLKLTGYYVLPSPSANFYTTNKHHYCFNTANRTTIMTNTGILWKQRLSPDALHLLTMQKGARDKTSRQLVTAEQNLWTVQECFLSRQHFFFGIQNISCECLQSQKENARSLVRFSEEHGKKCQAIFIVVSSVCNVDELKSTYSLCSCNMMPFSFINEQILFHLDAAGRLSMVDEL